MCVHVKSVFVTGRVGTQGLQVKWPRESVWVCGAAGSIRGVPLLPLYYCCIATYILSLLRTMHCTVSITWCVAEEVCIEQYTCSVSIIWCVAEEVYIEQYTCTYV